MRRNWIRGIGWPLSLSMSAGWGEWVSTDRERQTGRWRDRQRRLSIDRQVRERRKKRSTLFENFIKNMQMESYRSETGRESHGRRINGRTKQRMCVRLRETGKNEKQRKKIKKRETAKQSWSVKNRQNVPEVANMIEDRGRDIKRWAITLQLTVDRGQSW